MADAIEQTDEQSTSKLMYEQYGIWVQSYELKAGGWVPRALIVIPSDEGNGEQELLAPGTSAYATREEADAQAVAMSKQWVDERLAGRRQDRALPS